jgi:hypothetical protein
MNQLLASQYIDVPKLNTLWVFLFSIFFIALLFRLYFNRIIEGNKDLSEVGSKRFQHAPGLGRLFVNLGSFLACWKPKKSYFWQVPCRQYHLHHCTRRLPFPWQAGDPVCMLLCVGLLSLNMSLAGICRSTQHLMFPCFHLSFIFL